MIFLSLYLQRVAGIQRAQTLVFVSIRAVSLQILKEGASLNSDGRGFGARVNSDASCSEYYSESRRMCDKHFHL